MTKIIRRTANAKDSREEEKEGDKGKDKVRASGISVRYIPPPNNIEYKCRILYEKYRGDLTWTLKGLPIQAMK